MKFYNKFLAALVLIVSLVSNATFVLAKPAYKRTAPPAAPISLVYSGVTTSEATLSWQAVSSASGYKVYRATPNDSNYTLIASVSTNSYKNVSLSPNTKYWYFVRSYNSFGSSVDSAHINLTTKSLSTTTTTKKIVLGFTTYYYSGDTSSYNSLAANSTLTDEIATHTYITDSYGKISGLVPTNEITYANSNSIKALAMVSNNFDGNIGKALLETPSSRQALINNILNSLKANGYKGVNIDFEGLYYYDRSYLTTFMNELYNTLKPQGYYITMSVPAKTTDGATLAWSGAYDYASLSKYADQIVLMTYDEHYPGGTPGAIASIDWTESVIKYAASVIPKEKILLGTAAYGYDWSTNGTKAYGILGVYNLAANYKSTIQWDDASKSPYFTYSDAAGVLHSVWFENAQSLNYKLDLVNSYNLAGIAIWRLGLENPDYWTSIKSKIR